MSQWVKTLVTTSDDLSSNPGIHIVEGDARPPQTILTFIHLLWLRFPVLQQINKCLKVKYRHTRITKTSVVFITGQHSP